MELFFESVTADIESSFDRQSRNIKFLQEMMDQHLEMERYVNECLIKASGDKKAINEMYLIESGFGDKVKGFFEKIKNFFKKIFDKLGASMTAIFTDQKKYMDKYTYIITKCKWNAGDVSDIKDRFTGINRITDAIETGKENAFLGPNVELLSGENPPEAYKASLDIDFSTADAIEKQYADKEKTTKIEAGTQRDKLFPEFTGQKTYWGGLSEFESYKEKDSNGNVDIGATFSNWFNGGSDTTSYSSDEIDKNMQYIINTAYAGESLVKKITNLSDAIAKKMDAISKTFDNYIKVKEDKIKAAIAGTSTAKQTTSDTTKPTEVKQESYSYFTETNFKLNSTSSNNDKETAKTPNGNAGKETQDATNAAKKSISGMQATQANAGDQKNVDMQGKTGKDKENVQTHATDLLNVNIYNKQMLINESINISNTIINKLFAAFKDTNKDFFELIKAHVNWYLSNPGEDQKSDNKSAYSRTLNAISGDTPAKKANTNNDPETKPEQQSGGNDNP